MRVNNNQFGALHFINAPYGIGELLAAALRYRTNYDFMD
jgi:hypothetical protein